MADEVETAEARGTATIYNTGWAAGVDRPRAAARLPRIVRDALSIVWQAGPGRFVILLALQLVGGVGLLITLLLGRSALTGVLDANRGVADYGDVVPVALVLVAVFAVIGFAGAVQWEQQQLLTELVAKHTQGRLLDVSCAVGLLAYDRPSFHDRLSRAQAQRHQVGQLVFGIGGVVGAAIGIVASLAALLTIAPLLVLLGVLAVVPVLLVSGRRARRFWLFVWRMTPRDRERNYLAAMLTSRTAAAEVRSFGLLAPLRRRHDRLYDDRVEELRSVARTQLLWSLASTLTSALVIAAMLGSVGWLVSSDRMSLAEAGAGTAAVVLLAQRLGAAAFSANSLLESALFVEDYLQFLRIGRAEIEGSRRGTEPAGAFGSVEARDVSFVYPASSTPALRGVDIVVRSGETIALVGENGSGKTTLAKLLAGVYVPTGGTLLWNGRDAAGATEASLLDQSTLLLQDFVRWSLSARDNIAFGRHERADDDDAVRTAAATAGAEEVVAGLPDGYETQLGPEFEGGTELSGGQWQRLALARAFFRDSPLVILDEPTAALDARAEHALFERVGELLADRAVVLVSHRFSTVREADRIYVLDAGTVIESGTHDELMSLGGRYNELFTLQAAAYLED